jgi:hypothetical protein
VTRKPIGYQDQRNKQGRRIRIYDAPATPWQRLKSSGVLSQETISAVEEQLTGINPADLTRRINHIQRQLTGLAKEKTQALNDTKTLDLARLEPSIRKLAPKP